MTDLVKRLRSGHGLAYAANYALRDEAADRIESLEAEVAAWKSQCLEAEFQEAERSRMLDGAITSLTAMTENAEALAAGVEALPAYIPAGEYGPHDPIPIHVDREQVLILIAAHAKLMDSRNV